MGLSHHRRALIAAAIAVCTGAVPRALADFSLAPAVPIALAPGSAGRDVRALDVTGDGRLDLVVVSPDTPNVQVLVGLGGVAFGAPIVTALAPMDVFALGDVNGDGRPDLVTAPLLGTQTLQTYLGNGLGSFTAVSSRDVTGGVMFGISLLDADEDGHVDALLQQDSKLRLCLGDGAGGFAAPGPFMAAQFVGLHMEPHVLDVNGDGHLDFMSSGNAFFSYGWTVMLGDGHGGFTFSQEEFRSVDGDLYGSALGDFDGDHRTDFVLDGQDYGSQPGPEIAVAQGTGHEFALPSQSQFAAPSTSRIRAGDLDRDGLDDVVGLITKDGKAQLWILSSNGDFTFDAPHYVEVVDHSVWMQDVALSDVDGNGALDVLVLHDPGQVSIFLNQTPPSGWAYLGHALAGSDGTPSLLGQGLLQATAPGSLKLTHANPNKLAVLFIGPGSNPAAFKGGTLVPVPPTIMLMLATNGAGAITLPWNSWPHMPSGTDWFFQYGIVDSAAPAGGSLSNAVRALQP